MGDPGLPLRLRTAVAGYIHSSLRLASADLNGPEGGARGEFRVFPTRFGSVYSVISVVFVRFTGFEGVFGRLGGVERGGGRVHALLATPRERGPQRSGSGARGEFLRGTARCVLRLWRRAEASPILDEAT